jgi:predicted XRE-type DNA-binding protein
MKMKKNRRIGSTLDSFLKKEGMLEEAEALAIKETIAWQLDRAMKQRRISKKRLAELMRTSRTQVDRVLNPKNGNVTIETLQKAAAVVGRKVKVELV